MKQALEQVAFVLQPVASNGALDSSANEIRVAAHVGLVPPLESDGGDIVEASPS